MSVQAIAWVLEHSESVGVTRCVLVSIANHVDPDGEGWVRVDRVLREANCSMASYHRAVKWAVEHGELERDVNAGGSARMPNSSRPNLFRFVAIAEPADTGGSQDDDPTPERGSQDAYPRGTQDDYPRGTQIDYPRGSQDEGAYKEPSYEPSYEPSKGTAAPNEQQPLTGMPSAPAPPVDATKALQARAQEATRLVFERASPKPAVPFPGVKKIVARLLDAGWPDEAVVAACCAVPTISTGWVEAELRRRRPTHAAGPRMASTRADVTDWGFDG